MEKMKQKIEKRVSSTVHVKDKDKEIMFHMEQIRDGQHGSQKNRQISKNTSHETK